MNLEAIISYSDLRLTNTQIIVRISTFLPIAGDAECLGVTIGARYFKIKQKLLMFS
jgi:hypothetical protein